MKKSLYIFVALVTLVLGGYGVKASYKGYCNYNFDINDNNKNIDLKFGITSNGLVFQTVADKRTHPDTNTPLWSYKDDFEKVFMEKAYDSNTNTLKECPNLVICFSNVDTYLYVSEEKLCPDLYTRVSTITQMIPARGSNSNVATTETKCVLGPKPVRNKSYNIKVEFYIDTDGKKKYKIINQSNTSKYVISDAEYGITFDGNSYSIKNSDINKFYENCDSIEELYLEYIPGVTVDSSAFSIVAERPDDSVNGSYYPDEALREDIDDDIEGEDEEDLEGIAACAAIGNNSKTGKQIKKIITIMKIAIPLLIIVFSIIDLIKVLVSEDDKVFKGTWSNFIKRCIVGVVFFLIPALLRLLFTITEILDIYSIDADSIFCYLI